MFSDRSTGSKERSTVSVQGWLVPPVGGPSVGPTFGPGLEGGSKGLGLGRSGPLTPDDPGRETGSLEMRKPGVP